jgi:protease-4
MLVLCGMGAIVIISLGAFLILGLMDASFEFGQQVGVVEIRGIISDPKPVVSQLKEFRDNKDVKAIVLRIDSPGGGVGPSQEIYGEVVKTSQVKKVVASMGAIAASGGYYVASGADHIMANPGSITGSIGVVMEFANLEELLNKIGVSAFVLKSGKYKDVGSPFRQMTSQEKELLQGFIENVHQQFVATVAKARQIPEEEIQAMADGRILSGEQARALGLLDSLGNLQDAIALAAQLGGIEGEPSVVYGEDDRFSLLEDFLGLSVGEVIDEVTATALRCGYICVPVRGAGDG